MAIPAGVILIWAGSHATIPAGWSRETALDDKYPKAWGTENPNVTGGSNTHTHTGVNHSHTMISHTHTFTLSVDSSNNHFYNQSSSGIVPHTHSGTTSTTTGGSLQNDATTWGSSSNEPDNYKVIFIKPSGVVASIKTGIVVHYNGSEVPSGYLYCNGSDSTPDLRNRFLKGASTGGDSGIGTGNNNHGHTITHTHTANAHSHTGTSNGNDSATNVRNGGGAYECSTNGHTHPVTLNNTTVTVDNYTNTTGGNGDIVQPEYKCLSLLQVVTPSIKKGIVGMWLGSIASIPAGWSICDGNNGTLDLRDKFVKAGNSLVNNGATGGSNTHSHTAIPHTHTSVSHTHTGYSSASGSGAQQAWTDGSNMSHYQHTHGVTNVQSVAATFSTDGMTCGSSSNQPAYRTVAYIQLNKLDLGGAMLMSRLM